MLRPLVRPANGGRIIGVRRADYIHEQSTYRITEEARVCCKCELSDSRRVGSVYEGFDLIGHPQTTLAASVGNVTVFWQISILRYGRIAGI